MMDCGGMAEDGGQRMAEKGGWTNASGYGRGRVGVADNGGRGEGDGGGWRMEDGRERKGMAEDEGWVMEGGGGWKMQSYGRSRAGTGGDG